MGDAGPQISIPELAAVERDIHVLVTGFGPFKSFTINPSWLIASSLPSSLEPLEQDNLAALPPRPNHALVNLINRPQQDSVQPLRNPNRKSYRIHVHVYPAPVKVAYSTISSTISTLLNPATNPEQISYDYVLHIGLASGRDSYTLETVAHNKDYIITDVDECDGFVPGTKAWIQQGIPENLSVGWHGQDVLRRWEVDVDQKWDEHIKNVQPGVTGLRSWVAAHALLRHESPTSRKPVVKLSRDAGRFTCEYILMSSLAHRWKESNDQQTRAVIGHDSPAERIGKVAFLHVPNGISTSDVRKGVLVAEAAIRSLVASWEDGWRNPAVYADAHVGTDSFGFESRGTGDSL